MKISSRKVVQPLKVVSKKMPLVESLNHIMVRNVQFQIPQKNRYHIINFSIYISTFFIIYQNQHLNKLILNPNMNQNMNQLTHQIIGQKIRHYLLDWEKNKFYKEEMMKLKLKTFQHQMRRSKKQGIFCLQAKL